MIATRPTTQKERVLSALREASDGVCLAELPPDLAYTARNRISELSRDGHTIVSRICRVHNHKSTVRRYWLVGEQELPLHD